MAYLNVFEFVFRVEREGTPNAFEAKPFDAYAAALADMVDAKDRIEQLPSALQRIIAPVAGMLTPDAISTALAGKTNDTQAGIVRVALLESARLWFTEKLHAAVSHGPLYIHWTRDERVKL